MTNFEQLANLVAEDQEFTKELTSQDSAEKALALVKGKGIEMTLDEFKEFISAMKKAAKEQSGELSEDDLEDVAGGGWLRSLYSKVIKPAAQATAHFFTEVVY